MLPDSNTRDVPTSADTRESVVVFSARESADVLSRTVCSVLAYARPETRVEILVNGNPPLSQAIALRLPDLLADAALANVRLWDIAMADKANAWNQHIHHIWPDQGNAFYIDGYVRLLPDSLRLLRNRIAASPEALGGTGTPSVARTAMRQRELMLREGGLHGNFCVIKETALRAMKTRGIRLPVGIYRTDSTIGAYLSFGLDPGAYQWDPHKFIAIEPSATWVTDKKHWWRVSDVKSTLNRKKRQAQGDFENRSVRYHLSTLRMRPEHLPRTVGELVESWLAACAPEAQDAVRRSFFGKQALSILRSRRYSDLAGSEPRLVFDSRPLASF